ncbi:MAG: hypothetical protein RTU92_10460 [Candidatus Thorarchaeota archaeon]
MQIPIPMELIAVILVGCVVIAIIIAYCQTEHFDRTISAIGAHPVTRVVVGICLLVFVMVLFESAGVFRLEYLTFIIISVGLILSGIGVNGRYITLAWGIYGIGFWIYNIALQTEMIQNNGPLVGYHFIGGIVLIILSRCGIFDSEPDYSQYST